MRFYNLNRSFIDEISSISGLAEGITNFSSILNCLKLFIPTSTTAISFSFVLTIPFPKHPSSNI